MATILNQSTTSPAHTASAQATWATRVQTKHGVVTVKSYYEAQGHVWFHAIPSHSQPHSCRIVIAGKCDCPARLPCWHEQAAQEAERLIAEMLWSVLRYEFRLDSDMDAYWRGLATIQQLHIPSAGGYRATRAATITAMEVLG